MSVESIYGQALFDLAQEQNELDIVFGQIKFLLDNLINDDNTWGLFLNFFLNPKISFVSKERVIKKIFFEDDEKENDEKKRNKHDILGNFFLLVIKKNRFSYVKKMFDFFLDSYYANKNILHGEILSASPVSEDILEDVKKKLEKKFEARIIFKNLIDPSLIGGFIVKINETIIDASVKSELKNLKEHLLSLKLSG